MTWRPIAPQRPAFIRYALAIGLLASLRRDQHEAFAELRIGILGVPGIVASEAVFESVPSRSCE